MRIREIGIENFGLFNNCKLRLSPNMNIIQGENEAGKSTLLTFIRWVLFGFNRNEKLAPFSGGDPSGYLLLELEDKECVIRRQGRTLKGEFSVLLEGENLTGRDAEKLLRELLGSITDNVYKNVFAFGLNELQTIGTLNDSEVSSFLYSSGLYPGKLSLSAIMKELDDESGRLYSASKIAKKPLINQDLLTYEEIESQLEDYSKEPEQYNKCLEEMETTREQLQTIRAKIAGLEKKRDWLNVLSKGWPIWNKKRESERLIETIEVSDDFPAESLGDLELLKKEIESYNEQLIELETKLGKTEENIKEISVDYRFLENGAEIEALNSELSRFSDWKVKLDELDRQIADLESAIKNKLEERLGEGYTLELLLDNPLSFSYELNNTVRNTQDKLVDERVAIKQTEEKIADVIYKEKQLTLRQKDCEEELDKISVLKNLPEIKQAYETYKQLAPTRGLLERQIKDKEKPSAKPIEPSPLIHLISILAAALLAIVFAVFENWPVVIIGAALTVAGLAMYLNKNRHYKEAKKLWDANEKERVAELLDLKRQMEEIQNQLLVAKQILSDNDHTEEDVLDLVWQEIQNEDEKWARTENLKNEIRVIEKQRAILKEELDTTNISLQEKIDTNEKTKQQWSSFLDENKLPDMEPLNILEWLSAYRELKMQAEELAKKRKERGVTQNSVNEFLEKANGLAEVLGKTLENTEVDVISWIKELKDNNRNLNTLKELESDRNEIQTEKKIVEEKKKHAMGNLDAILLKGKASSLEEFRVLAKKKEEKEQLQRDITILEINLSSLVGTEDLKERLFEDLKKCSEEMLLGTIQDSENELRVVLEDERQTNEHLGGLREKLSQLETSKETEKFLKEKAKVKQKLNSNAKKWIEVVICRYLIEKARTTYEKEKQPGVIRAASNYFKTITDGKYIKVMSPLTEQRFEVLSEDQMVKKPEELSRGTLEQLLLCLRLGLISEFAKHQAPLPLVVDDILVNFDPQRAVNTLKILSDLESMHQVLFFTCQTHLVRLCEDNNIEYSLTILKNGVPVKSGA
ncbi:MAG: AAA family ATPase [Firmicutes bacterium]|nr:AAA family ATPase [Bacillota bacterium]MDD4263070.1 AAA family ATPase [Bacillota bacterium]MDD4693296.1 AAA family ATPase [Bacillota bacterium]